MKTIEIKLYKFSELSKEAKQKAITELCDINVNYDWRESSYEDAKNIGLKITGFDLDREGYCNGEFLLSANEVCQNIFNEHGEMCETYKTAESFMEEWQPVFNEYMRTEEGEDELLKLENDFLKSILKNYYILLSGEYDYRGSEKAIIETIETNEYDFTEDGKLY